VLVYSAEASGRRGIGPDRHMDESRGRNRRFFASIDSSEKDRNSGSNSQRLEQEDKHQDVSLSLEREREYHREEKGSQDCISSLAAA
jgi:hypothetical protein